MKNNVAFALGKMGAWALNTHDMTENTCTTCTSPPGISCLSSCDSGCGVDVGVHLAFAVWGIALAALAATLLRLRGDREMEER